LVIKAVTPKKLSLKDNFKLLELPKSCEAKKLASSILGQKKILTYIETSGTIQHLAALRQAASQRSRLGRFYFFRGLSCSALPSRLELNAPLWPNLAAVL
jgi:hypothetical protein